MEPLTRHSWLRRLLAPSLSDCLFIALVICLFAMGGRWATLLADGDTGWHIRTGEYVLEHGDWPHADLFSFSKAGSPWYAWEWLAGVIFALAYRALALKGVVLLAGLIIALAAVVVCRHAVARGANLFAALAAVLLGVGAGSIHYLARPHVFTLLLWAVSWWLIDAGGRRVWLLVPLTVLWTNLHGGFIALLVSLAALAAGAALEAALRWGPWRTAGRYGALCAACSAASLVNPYGWRLHVHIASYLRSDWIRNAVDEFQSPKFRSETALHFEILLFAGVIVAGALLARRRIGEGLLILIWGHAALVSARHVPLFAILAAPAIAAEATRLWRRWAEGRPAKSVAVILDRVATDLAPAFARTSLWTPALAVALAFIGWPIEWPRDFPHQKFPIALVERNRARLAGARVFTSDQWGDYLIYRFYPGQRVFIDGRSDFYGPELGKQYVRAVQGHPEWRQLFERHQFTLVLAAEDWPLAGVLRQEAGWRLADREGSGLLFETAPLAGLEGRRGPEGRPTSPRGQ